MAETMSHLEGVLWRIAELGARCSQREAAGARGPLWAELEEVIAGLDGEFEAGRQATEEARRATEEARRATEEARRVREEATARVRTIEGRLKVAQQQRDTERARVKECFADAEAARRERDRERQKACKAMAATVAAKNTAAEAIATAGDAEAKAAKAVARANAAGAAAGEARAARDEAVAARDEAVAARDEALAALDDAVSARDEALAARDEALEREERAVAGRNAAVRARDKAVEALDDAKARIIELEEDLEAARAALAERQETTDREEAPVVVLPGVSLPEAAAGPVAPAARVSWQPTWSEWANPENDADDIDAADVSGLASLAGGSAEGAREISLEDPPDGEEGDSHRYLNVAATIAGLLPADLTPLLVGGSTVVRREGRLFATVAVPVGRSWVAPGSDGQQAERFADAGFRVEWASGAPLGV